jgi:hypothetical protein
MEDWAVLQNWAVFVPIVAGLTAYYYWPRAATSIQTKVQPVQAVNNIVKSEKGPAPKQKKASTTKTPTSKVAASKEKPAPSAKEKPASHANETKAKDKVDSKVEQDVVSVEEEADDSLREAREFAKRMTEARQGVEVKSNDIKGGRVKTVKQSSAISADNLKASTAHAESADEEESQEVSTTRDAGSVADMLEPSAPAPTTLRITPSEKPSRANGQSKQQKDKNSDAPSKKARQNERKKEEQRLQREEDEKIRKALEEKQRRTAREARGEAAKNGIPVPAKAPASNSWTATPSATPSAEQGSQTNIALLDTFDEASSSTAKNGISTTSRSDTDAQQPRSQANNGSQANTTSNTVDEQLDDAAWTTAGSKRKQKKSHVAAEKANDVPVLPKPVNPAVAKPTTNGKPIGFQALTDEYEQRTDVDANDASNWDA